ncbi:MAG: sn-glycerol-3-phosphate ABC transporter ATP-binding protein UgpC [Deltaproteobacteria bacterium]|nr:sn-glycerol-3-phosphate ABC transporter ATP-binding protein UgpC [Deltaproteobacteria bacterium]
MASVTIRQIRKTYPGTGLTILKGIDLEIPDGSLTVLVGPSGCGKSTLLRTLAGLERPDSGEIRIGDRDVTRLEPRDRDVAMVFQSYALYPHLTVRENLAFGLKLRGAPQSEIDARIAEVAPQLKLEAFLDRLPRALSGGQRQRVAMGRAIVRRPSLFLFDEPLSNLDAALRGEVRVEIRRLHDRLGATMVYVTHDQVEAMTLADQLVVLNGGVIEQAGPPLEVYARPKTRFVASFLGMPPMNFVDATLERVGSAVRARGKGLDVEVARARLPKADAPSEAGRAVVVGIRPQDVKTTDRAPAPVDLRFELVEGLGFESHVHGKLGEDGAPFVARLEGDEGRRIPKWGKLALEVAPADVHVFDRETGRALAE